jgi:flagellar biogenesis protein FliO
MGFQITFVNIGHALFSGLMVANVFLSVVFLISAYLLGKWLLPKLAEQITQDNQDMVNLTILKDHDKID